MHDKYLFEFCYLWHFVWNHRKCLPSKMNHLHHTSAKPQTDSTSHFCDERERWKFWVKWFCDCNYLIHWQINLDVLVGKWSYACCHNLSITNQIINFALHVKFDFLIGVKRKLPELICKGANNLIVLFHPQE